MQFLPKKLLPVGGLILMVGIQFGCASRTLVRTSEWENLQSTVEQQSTTIKNLQEENSRLENQVASLQEQLSGLNKRIEALKSKNQELRDRLVKLENRVNKLEANLRNNTVDKDKLEEARREINRLKERLRELENQQSRRIENLRQQNQELSRKLSDIKATQTRQEGQNVVISLKTDILFDLGKYELKPESRKTLNAIADVLKKYPNRPIAVEGHTDTVPVAPEAPYPSNWHLSAYRAVSVVKYLTDKGMNPDRFRAIGYGEHHPIKPNTSPENRRLNRRVEIVLFPPEFKTETIEPASQAG